MTDSPDERSHVRRGTEDGNAEDAREEYTSYRERDPDTGDPDEEAVREADLQPGSPDPGTEPDEERA
jgi:hypothetical protein